MRTRVVVTGDQAPQPATAQQGYRHRGAHTHVLQIFDVDGGHAAQRRVGQVHRGPAFRIRGRYQGSGRVVDIGDEAKPVLLVHRARLCRDVAGGVVQSQEGVQVVAFGFGDHLAVVVPVVAVHHHPVESGEVAHRPGRGVIELGQSAGPVQILHRAADCLIGVGERKGALAVGDLDFDQQDSARLAVQQGVERPGSAGNLDLQLQRVALAQIPERGRRLPQRGGLFGTDQGRQILVEHVGHGSAEQVGDVGTDLADPEARLPDHGQYPSRLDAARDVDRFACAIVEIDDGSGREQAVNGDIVGVVGANGRPPRSSDSDWRQACQVVVAPLVRVRVRSLTLGSGESAF